MLELEKKRITKEEGLKAQRAMQALEVKDAGGVKSEDVAFVVSSAIVLVEELQCQGN